MILGSRPGPERVDPVGHAPAEVVAMALRCERLEAVAEAAREYDAAWRDAEVAAAVGSLTDADNIRINVARDRLSAAVSALDAALVAAGATGKAGT